MHGIAQAIGAFFPATEWPMARLVGGQTAFDHSFTAIDGKPMPLEQYRGEVLLVVNTASECGYTPQYAGLEELSRRYRDHGLVIIGVPSNDFGAQEPGNDAEIAGFCRSRYRVSFPLTRKEPVIGENAHPFYKLIAGEIGEDHLPKWNFTKYLVARDGAIRGVFPSRVKPDSPDIVTAIEAELERSNR
jgi:glutathione peroxidase